MNTAYLELVKSGSYYRVRAVTTTGPNVLHDYPKYRSKKAGQAWVDAMNAASKSRPPQ